MSNFSNDVIYNISVKLTGIEKGTSETDEQLEQRIIHIARNRLSAYLSGNVYDPDKKVFTEKIRYEEKD